MKDARVTDALDAILKDARTEGDQKKKAEAAESKKTALQFSLLHLLAFIVLVVFAIVLLTPAGRYFLYNATDGFGDVKVIKKYLADRGIPIVDDSLTRRNLGTTRNCEASFKTDPQVFQKVIAEPHGKLVEDGLNKFGQDALSKTPENRRPESLRELLKLSPHLTPTEQEGFVKDYQDNSLWLYREEQATLPQGWTYVRFLVNKLNGQTCLFYAR